MNHLVGLRSNGCWTASAMFARNTAKLSLADASESPFLDWPRKGNPKEGHPASAPCGHPALRVRARRPRSAIAHPCASAACATSCRAPFGLLRPPVTAAEGSLEQRTLPACRIRVKSSERIDVTGKTRLSVRAPQRSQQAPLSQGGRSAAGCIGSGWGIWQTSMSHRCCGHRSPSLRSNPRGAQA